MGPRHASGGLGRTPNPGLAVCAGLRTRASGDRASKDGFTASPAIGPTPPSPSKPASAVASAVASEVAGQRPALPRVQGCKPCRTSPPPTKVGRPARQHRTILEPMTLSGRAAS
ncbi:hypothetical protein D7Y49_22965 [Stenotrophomonas maltophilia]|nr:hypothetical protein [Stenotrophomonas maltophilia]MBA0332533.1 hypothetical protein [Stenotrophomonas maltophilia]